ncbi:MAG: hypothetical protein QW815_01450 [Nitrososphaerota archaeon]
MSLLVHPGRILGAFMGVLILIIIFTLPFTSDPSITLFEITLPLLENINLIPGLGDQATVFFAYILIFSFILLVIAGIVGIFPLGTGILGVIGMGLITLAPFFFLPGTVTQPLWGLGYYMIWAASIVSLVGSFWHGKPKQPPQPTADTGTSTHYTAHPTAAYTYSTGLTHTTRTSTSTPIIHNSMPALRHTKPSRR